MVALARQALGRTQAEFAKCLGISQGYISKIEDGFLPKIDESLLLKFTGESGYPRHFFQQKGEQRPLRESFFRRKSTMSAKLLRQCEALINIRRIEIEKLLACVEPDTKLPRPVWEPDEFAGGPREIARQLRAAWGVPRGPVYNLIQLIEDAGIVVMPFDFGSSQIEGVSIWTSDGTPVILYNSTAVAVRQRLTIAHELGHVIMHRLPTPHMEEEAYDFGAEFLMPEGEIKPTLFPLNLERLSQLKQRWRVSMQAILVWARQIGGLKESYYKVLMMKLSQAGWKKMEPFDDLIVNEKPRLIHDMVELHLMELGYSPNELRDKLCAKGDTFDRNYLSI